VRAKLAAGVAGASGAVGLRCSPHPVAAGLARLARRRGVGPLTATSLNRSGEPDCRTRADAERIAGAEIPLVDGSDAGGEPPSSVVDATGEAVVLREGALSRRAIARVLEGTPA
ncbi:MAG: Sua5/YciO/YrdC/YwlC family protein, partial [Myxococcota bacterium]